MPMPSVLQGGISSQTDIAQQLVGRGSTDLHPCHRRRFVPGVTRLHESDQLPFCRTSLFLLNRLLLIPVGIGSSPVERLRACLIQSQHVERYGRSRGRTCSWNLAN